MMDKLDPNKTVFKISIDPVNGERKIGQLLLSDDETRVVHVSIVNDSTNKIHSLFEGLLEMILKLFTTNYGAKSNELKTVTIDPVIKSITFTTGKSSQSLLLEDEQMEVIARHLQTIADKTPSRIGIN